MKKDRIKSASREAATQHAALCYRHTGAGSEVLLVTSRDTGRWVLPKGWPKKSEDGAETALREAFEEAGVIGRAEDGCFGIYCYDKTMTEGFAIPCCVAVHVIEVSHLEYRYPEMGLRERVWFDPAAAAEAVAEPELKSLLADFRPGHSDGLSSRLG